VSTIHVDLALVCINTLCKKSTVVQHAVVGLCIFQTLFIPPVWRYNL